MPDRIKLTYSLLVPCYNAESYIDSFLKNISALALPFDEVIFYDDASTDNTAQLLQNKGFKVIRGEMNKGPGFARNKLAELAGGDYIHFHDIDDALKPDYLIRKAELAEQDIYDVILCNVNWYDARSKKLLLAWKYSDKAINEQPVSYTINHPIGGINGLYRKNKFRECGGFDTGIRIWEDADIHVRLAAKGARFTVIEEELSYSWRYNNSASANQCQGWLTRLSLLQSYQRLFKNKTDQIAIGKQAQVAAGNLILLGMYSAAKEAYRLSESCNLKVPYNNSLIWGIAKLVLPKAIRIELRFLQLKRAFNKG